jgi:hypothetical protein
VAITAFSNFSITISDGGTVPSLDYLSNKTFVNIGSGNILKVHWNTPTATNNFVDSYKIYILRYDNTSASYKTLYNANIGNVNEFYLKAALFDSVAQSFNQLRIYVEAISRYGASYNGLSNTVTVNVSKGCGSYIRVEAGYKQPIMKRAIAFAKVDLDYKALAASDDTLIADESEKVFYTKVSSVQEDTTGWTLMQNFYTRDTSGNWQLSDIAYEALVDTDGELFTDQNNEIIYVL